MYLRDIGIYLTEDLKRIHGSEFNVRFPALCFSTSSHFLHHLRKQKLAAGEVRKVCIELVETPPCETKNLHIDGSGILFTSRQFNINSLDSLNAYEQKFLILDLIRDVLVHLATKLGGETASIDLAYDLCMQDKMIFEHLFTTPIRHPSRDYNAKLSYRMEPFQVHIFAHLFKNRSSKQLSKKLLGSTRANYGAILQLKELVEWSGPNTLKMKVRGHRMKIASDKKNAVSWGESYWEVTFDELD
ncbi:hypothetical protein Pla110_02160 [Polystyrenella longa]|uniref:Uncharacterized protein n=1 Tax=Polystyrenella longa TaxID=2528007 RepID=A0A518CH11_9PLAN|nr:hypothetical protein [Polystyrenella longa]QDU78512.1 hypothetical protein Pla110_02160 [Polystyrenella longa]